MYDDYDHSYDQHRSRGAGGDRDRDRDRDHDHDHEPHRHRSPVSRDHRYRSRHASSRSPARTSPPRGGRDRDREGQYDNQYDKQHYDTHRRDYRSSRGLRDTDHDYDDRDDGQVSGPSSPRHSPDRDSYHRDAAYHHGPGRPHHTLKLDEVPDRVDYQDIDDAMRDMGARGLVQVRTRFDDRAAGRWGYAFAEFKYESDAVDFLERYYPSITIKDRTGSAARIYMEYSRERRQPVSADDWKCTLCHFDNFSRRTTCKQCKAPRSSENAAEMKLDGQSDECPQQTPSPFMVVRGLASSTNESVLAAGIKKLYLSKEDELKQTSAAPSKLKSTAPIGNTHGLGAKPGSLVRVFMVRDKASDISCNYGFAEFSTLEDARAAMAKFNAHPQFTISSKPVTITYIHSGVFIPYLHPVQDHDRKFTFSATHNPSLRLSYWNPSVYVSELLTFDESLYEDKGQKTGEKRDPAQSTGKESKKRKADKDLAAPGSKKGIAMAPQLQMWANKHAELHNSKGSNDLTASEELLTGPNAIVVAAPSLPPSISYADLEQMCCLLCRRKFSNEPSLRRHEQISDMHKSNVENDALIIKATEDLKALGKEPAAIYRDRARERRLAHNQPTKPKPHLPKKQAPESAPVKEATKPVVSKGAGLLAKMGWTSGEGLGVEAGGRKEIIETIAYTPGVGLGAEGGKLGDATEEASRATKNDYKDFVSRAKDKARERYEKMG